MEVGNRRLALFLLYSSTRDPRRVMGPLWDRPRTRVDLQWGCCGVISIADLPLFRSCQGGLWEEPRQAPLSLVTKEPMLGDESAMGQPKDPLVYDGDSAKSLLSTCPSSACVKASNGRSQGRLLFHSLPRDPRRAMGPLWNHPRTRVDL